MIPTAVLDVDLEALEANFRTLGRVSGASVQPVVKADAYGLGAAAVVDRLMRAGARTVFVARAEGGAALRAAVGPDLDIYVLDGCLAGRAADLRRDRLRPVLNTGDQLAEWRAAGGGPCAIQIDTGMNRLGFRPEDAPDPFDGLGMVISHLACADDPQAGMNRRQRDAFAAVSARYPGAVRSLANSGGCFLGPGYAFDAVRPGICLYGGGPQGRPDPRIRPVATFSAEVLQVRDVPAGESVGYGRAFVAERPTQVAVVGAGYADGLPRAAQGGRVFIGGALRPLVGRVSMDVCAVDATGLDVAVGDRAELFGPNHPVDDAARDADTIAYERLTAVSARVQRRYRNG